MKSNFYSYFCLKRNFLPHWQIMRKMNFSYFLLLIVFTFTSLKTAANQQGTTNNNGPSPSSSSTSDSDSDGINSKRTLAEANANIALMAAEIKETNKEVRALHRKIDKLLWKTDANKKEKVIRLRKNRILYQFNAKARH